MKWHNKIDNRLTLLSGAMFLFLFFINSLINVIEYKSELAQWRESQSQSAKQLFINLFNNEFEILSEFVENYASDDQLHQLVNNHQVLFNLSVSKDSWPISSALLRAQNKQFVAQKLAPSLLEDNHFNSAFVQDNNGDLIYAVTRLDSQIKTKLFELMNTPESNNERGVAVVDNRIFLYIKKAIIDTDKEEPSNGFLTILCLLNGKKIDNISQSMNKTLFLIEQESALIDARYNVDYGLSAKLSKQILSDKNDLFTYHLFADYDRLLPFKINVSLPTAQRKATELYYRLAIQFLLFIVYTLAAFYLIKRYIAKPLARLLGDLNALEENLGKPNKNLGGFLMQSELGGIYHKFESLYLRLDQKHKLNDALLNAIGDIIITVDEQGLITYVNPPAEKWLGFSQQELLTQPLSLFVVNLQQTVMSTTHWLYNALKKGQEFHQECQLRRLSDVHKVDKMEVIVRPLVGLDNVSGAMITLRSCGCIV